MDDLNKSANGKFKNRLDKIKNEMKKRNMAPGKELFILENGMTKHQLFILKNYMVEDLY